MPCAEGKARGSLQAGETLRDTKKMTFPDVMLGIVARCSVTKNKKILLGVLARDMFLVAVVRVRSI